MKAQCYGRGAAASLLLLSPLVLAAPGGLTLEQRMAQLESRVVAAERRAANAEAEVKRLRQEGQTGSTTAFKAATTDPAVATRPAAAGTVVTNAGQLSLDERVARIEAQQHSVGVTPAPVKRADSGFKFGAYARSGFLANGDKAGRGGSGVTPAGSIGGHVGRLGNEPDTYMEAKFSQEQQVENGTRWKYFLMLADGVQTPND